MEVSPQPSPQHSPQPRRWARTLGEMREELGMPATPLGASSLLSEFDAGDLEATPLIAALQAHVARQPQLVAAPKPRKAGPKVYAAPVLGGAEAALDVLRREHRDTLRQMKGLQDRAAQHEQQMLEQERRHAALLVAERARLKQEYEDALRDDLKACQELQRRLESTPAATIAEMEQQVVRRETVAANQLKRAEAVWKGERAALEKRVEMQKKKSADDALRWEKGDKKTEARLATALAKVKTLKLELKEERSERAEVEAKLSKLQLLRRSEKTAPSPRAAAAAASPALADRADSTEGAAADDRSQDDTSFRLNSQRQDQSSTAGNDEDQSVMLRAQWSMQAKLQAANAQLAVCRKSLRHEQAAAAKDRMKLAAFEAKRAKELSKQRCAHCGRRAAMHPDDHHGPVALADPARGGSPAHLGKMAVGQWRGGEREELQKLCVQVLGAARLAVGMPAVDPRLAETMSAMQQTWASAMQGEIEPAATLLLRSKSAAIDAPGSEEEIPFGYRTTPTDEENAAAARLQAVARGKKERRRQRDLDADIEAEDGGGVRLLSNLVSSLSVRRDDLTATNPRKAALVDGEPGFDPRAALRSATRSVAMAIASAARLGIGRNLLAGADDDDDDARQSFSTDAKQPAKALPEVVEAVGALIDDVCVQCNEALGGYTVRLVGAQGLAPRLLGNGGGSGDTPAAFLPPPDVNAFAVLYVNGAWAGESGVALQTVAPFWNAEVVLRGSAMLHGSHPPADAPPNSIAVALFDYARDGNHTFLGQAELSATLHGGVDSLDGLPTQDAREVTLRPHPDHPKDRVRGSVLMRVCQAGEPQAVMERGFTRKRSSSPAGGWGDELALLAEGIVQDGSVTEAEKEWMDVSAAANAGGLCMRRWWSHTIEDEPGSGWVYDLVLLGADVNLEAIDSSSSSGTDSDSGASRRLPDLYVECHLNGELLGHSLVVCESVTPRWVPAQTIPLSSLQIQNGATNQLVLTVCDYRRHEDDDESDGGYSVVGSLDLRGVGATALPTEATHLPLMSTAGGGAVGTVEIVVGRRRRDVNQRAAEAEWAESQLAAAVESARLRTRLRRQKVALAQALTAMQAAGRQAAAAESLRNDADAAAATLTQRLQNLAAARDKDKAKRKELRRKVADVEKTQNEAVAKAVAEAVHDVQTDAARADELGAYSTVATGYCSTLLLAHTQIILYTS